MLELQSGEPVALPLRLDLSEAQQERRQPAWWLWINICSLDAPIVAMLWHLLLAKALALKTGFAVPAALGCAVWVIYLADRILDTRHPACFHPEPARKIFVRNHWQLMLSMGAIALVSTVALTYIFLDSTLFRAGLMGGVLVSLYLGSVHLLPAALRPIWPREATVALLFSSGVGMPVWLANGFRTSQVLPYLVPLFLLCWLNCCAVEVWDWQSAGSRPQNQPSATALWIADHLACGACSIVILSAVFGALEMLRALYVVALVLSALSFVVIERLKLKVLRDRRGVALPCVLIDFALCSPLPILAALRLLPVKSFWS